MEGVTVCCCFASGHKGMISVVRRTGHSSYYVEKGMNAMGKTPKQLGIQTDYKISGGGEHPYSLTRRAVLGMCANTVHRSVSNMA